MAQYLSVFLIILARSAVRSWARVGLSALESVDSKGDVRSEKEGRAIFKAVLRNVTNAPTNCVSLSVCHIFVYHIFVRLSICTMSICLCLSV